MPDRGRGPDASALPWTSTLSSAEAGLLATAGLVPVGFVTAASVWTVGFQWGQGIRSKAGRRPPGFSYLYPCPHTPGTWGPGAGLGAYGGASGRLHTLDGHEPGINWEHRRFQQGLTAAFDSAYADLLQRIAAMGAHGAVGVRVQQTYPRGPGQLVEFSMWGTAVRQPGSPPLPTPFATNASASELVKLLQSGWVTAGLVMAGAAIEAERGCVTRMEEAGMVGNLYQYADAIDQARALAVARLEENASRLGEAVVGCHLDQHLSAERHSYGAQVTLVGSAIRRFHSSGRNAGRPLTILSLSGR